MFGVSLDQNHGRSLTGPSDLPTPIPVVPPSSARTGLSSQSETAEMVVRDQEGLTVTAAAPWARPASVRWNCHTQPSRPALTGLSHTELPSSPGV